MTDNPLLISADALMALLGRPGTAVVDASWYMPAQNRDAKAEFAAAHVPGAVFFDQDDVVDPTSTLPHTLPLPEIFSSKVGALGLAETDTIVVYDGMGVFSAPRVWWMLRVFGARDVRLLDGGLPAWIAAGGATERGTPEPTPKRFTATFDQSAVATLGDMRAIAAHKDVQVADARPAERFSGAVAEPRAGVASGHIPGSRSVPFGLLVENGRLKSADDLRAAFEAAGIDPSKPVVTTCGSGVTAAVLSLALETLHTPGLRLYDGSWSEWGTAPGVRIETGDAAPKMTGAEA